MPLRFLRLFPLLLVLAAGDTLAQDVPKLKPGLWEMSTTSDRPTDKGRPPNVATVCLDAPVQALLLLYLQEMVIGKCADYRLTVAGNVANGEAVCKHGNSTTKLKSALKFAADTALHTEVDATYTPPAMGILAKAHTVVESKFVGPCPATLRPGDIKAGEGPLINLREFVELPAPKKGP